MTYNFTQEQVSTAEQVLQAVPQATPTEQLALMEAGLVESGMRNLNYGDRDSLGVFQERPSQGWTNVNNVTAATQEMLAHFNTSLTDPGAMAQSGERSAFPGRYDQMQGEAIALLDQAKAGLGQQGSGFGQGTVQTQVGGAITDPVTNAISGIESWVGQWAPRVGLIVIGGLFMLVGMYLAFKDTGAGKAATKVAKVAAI